MDRDGDGLLQKGELGGRIYEIGNFLHSVHHSELTLEEISTNREALEAELFRDELEESLNLEIFKQRAMNNDAVLHSFRIFEFIFSPVEKRMITEMGLARKTFQRDLSEVLRSEGRQIPLVLEKTMAHLMDHGKLLLSFHLLNH